MRRNIYKAVIESYLDKSITAGKAIQLTSATVNNTHNIQERHLVYNTIHALINMRHSDSAPIPITYPDGSTSVYSTREEALSDVASNLTTYYPGVE